MSVILETERLSLRRWTWDDVAPTRAIYGDAEVTRFLRLTARTEDEARVILKRRLDGYERYDFGLWAVEERATGQVVGSCGLIYLDGGPEIEVGYHFARASWGKGYATEAAAACVQYAFERLHLEHLLAVVNPANAASRRVLEKIGMTYERTGWYYDNDLLVYSMRRPPAPESTK